MELRPTGYPIRALSVGGIETCYEIPTFDLLFDIGRCPPGAEQLGTLLLTHAHIDHAAGIPYYISLRSLMKRPPPRVFCPAEVHEPLTRILAAWAELDADSDQAKLIGVSPGDTIPLSGGAYAKVFRSPHRVVCNGYTIFKRKQKLLPELQGLSESTIRARARSGEPVTSFVDTAELCFPGDTTIEVVEREETVRTARVLLLECTFLGAKMSARRARAGGHVHLEEIAERAELFENEVVVLTHFSRRYSSEEILAEVDRRIPERLRARIRLLMPQA